MGGEGYYFNQILNLLENWGNEKSTNVDRDKINENGKEENFNIRFYYFLINFFLNCIFDF